MAKHKTPDINSSSTADIAFLLLAYFLMTTTMNQDSGLARRLPPIPDPNQKIEDQQINKRNIIIVRINAANKILVGNSVYTYDQLGTDLLKNKIVNFLDNPTNDPTMPEKEDKEIEGFGTYKVSKGVISLQNDRGTQYKVYIAVQNELVKAVNELRNKFASEQWGVDNYLELDEEKQKIVRKAVPQQISEAAPKETGKHGRR